MIKNNSISVIGGDTRQLYAAHYLISSGFDVKIYACEHGKFKNDINLAENLTEALNAQTILLPLPVSKNAGLLNTPLSSREIMLKEITDAISEEQLIYLGMGQQSLIKHLKAKTDFVFDYFKNEEFILKNAKLTAEGIVSIIFERLPVSVVGLKTAITGFGRIGAFTADILNKLGADVTVFARNPLQLTKAVLQGTKALNLTQLNAPANNFECIINTIPARVINEEFVKNSDADCLFIEAASAPYGINFESCDKYNRNLVKAFSLPGKTVPKSAGIVIGQTIENHLLEVKKCLR